MKRRDGKLMIAVDAGNLVRDQRGMGRVARGVLRVAIAEGSVTIALLVERPRDAAVLAGEFPGLEVRAAATARRAGRYDVVWFPFNGMRYRAAAPTLVSMYDAFAFTWPARGFVARRREQKPIVRAAREATAIAVCSQWTRAEIARELGVAADRMRVIAPAPDPYWFPSLAEPPLPLAGKRYALVVAGSEARKNVRLALEACARALHGPGELLVIAGSLAHAERRFARSLRLRALEVVPSDMLLRSLYRNAAVVLVPSLGEGFGLVAVEAMACAAPVIAANAGALPEATDGAALLLDPRDPGAWSTAIRTMFDDSGIASSQRARAAARFAFADRTAPARATLALLRELAGGRAT